jgi:hypothetical protein
MNNEASQATCLHGAELKGFVTLRKPLVIIDTPAAETEAARYSLKPAPVLLTSEELASRWRITRQKVNQMRTAGQLRAIQLPSGTFRYDLEEILRLEKPVLPSRQEKKARSAEAIKRGRAKAGASKAGREVNAIA